MRIFACLMGTHKDKLNKYHSDLPNLVTALSSRLNVMHLASAGKSRTPYLDLREFRLPFTVNGG